MSQQRIISLLKRHYNRNKERWFTAKDMARWLRLSNGSVTTALKKMRDSKLIRFKTIKSTFNIFQYKYR